MAGTDNADKRNAVNKDEVIGKLRAIAAIIENAGNEEYGKRLHEIATWIAAHCSDETLPKGGGVPMIVDDPNVRPLTGAGSENATPPAPQAHCDDYDDRDPRFTIGGHPRGKVRGAEKGTSAECD